MPSRIHTSRENRVVPHVHLLQFPVVGNHRTAMILTRMELHPVGIIVLVMMTVDALSFHFLTAQHIVVDHALVVILQATLTDGQLLV